MNPPAAPPILIVTEQDLQQVGAARQVQEFKSPVTDVTYRFVRYVWEAKGLVFVPLIEDANPSLSFRWIRQTPSPDATGQMASDSDRYIAASPQAGLIRFPDERNANLMQAVPIFREIASQGFSFVGPRWCISALSTLEINPAVNKVNQFTMVMPDRLLIGGNIVERQGQVFNGLLDLQNPDVKKSLSITIPVKGKDASGQDIVTPTVFDGDMVLADATFRTQYLATKTLTPTNAISNTLIGRPHCIDLISIFVVPATTITATPIPVTPAPGFQPPPVTTTTGTTIPTPSGAFVPPPAVGGGGGTVVMGPSVALTSEQTAAVDRFLLETSCNKGGGLARADSAIKKITDEAAKGFPRLSKGDYINMSTCRVVGGSAKTIETWVGDFIPGHKQTLNLTMTRKDLAGILTKDNIDTLNDPSVIPQIREVFRRAQYIIFQRMGSTTSSVEEGAVTVPMSILDSIPPGPVPVVRPSVVQKTTFIEQAALSGVIELTVPITDGQRCLPGLGAKKRD